MPDPGCWPDKSRRGSGARSSKEIPPSRAISSCSMRSSIRGTSGLSRKAPSSIFRSIGRALQKLIRDEMLPDGGWAQYRGGPPEISVSVLSYFALRVAGESPDAPDMRRSRETILGLGGVEHANSYTKYHLALLRPSTTGTTYRRFPPRWCFLPGRGPFTVYDMSSWSRTIFVPLSILYARKPVVSLARGTRCRRAVSAGGSRTVRAAGRR